MNAAAEGVVRFKYRLAPARAPFDARLLGQLNAWRCILRRTGLIGATPDRYGGFGFGNVSARERGGGDAFVITASQTGRFAALAPEQFVRVVACDVERFEALAEGVAPPSSEALTHAALYRAAPTARWVFHGHSPDIFRAALALGLPTTPATVEYGTADMARCVAELFARERRSPLVFASLGHEDGVFACGTSADAAGSALVATLARALARRGASAAIAP